MAEPDLWRAILIQAVIDAYGAYDPWRGLEENKKRADEKLRGWKKKGLSEHAFRYFKPEIHTEQTRHWIRSNCADFIEVCEYAGQCSVVVREKMIISLEYIEKMELYFLMKYGS